jgi:hypothetical protein
MLQDSLLGGEGFPLIQLLQAASEWVHLFLTDFLETFFDVCPPIFGIYPLGDGHQKTLEPFIKVLIDLLILPKPL